jgi:hypothetical protein
MANNRIIRIEDKDVVVGKGRGAKEIQLPPFSYSGTPSLGSQSGRWHPYVPLHLMWIQITSRVSGSARFEILTSNIASFSPTASDTTVLTTVGIDGQYSLTQLTGTIEQYAITRNQWIAVKCVHNTSCEDVVITMIGRQMGQEGREA